MAIWLVRSSVRRQLFIDRHSSTSAKHTHEITRSPCSSSLPGKPPPSGRSSKHCCTPKLSFDRQSVCDACSTSCDAHQLQMRRQLNTYFFRNTYFYYDIKRPMKSTTNWQKPDTTSIQVIFLAGVICIRDFRTVLRNQWRQVVLIFSHFGKWLSLQICTSRFTIMLFTILLKWRNATSCRKYVVGFFSFTRALWLQLTALV